MLYQKEGNLKAALADYDRIVEINPNYGEPYYARGQIYEEGGQHDKALAQYNKAIEINPNYGSAYSKRALLYYARGEYKNALEDLKKAKIKGIAVSEEIVKQIEEATATKR